MATKRWRGDAPAVAQVDTLTVGGTIEAGDKFKMTINGKTLSVAASSTSASTTATEIADAWNASTIPEFAEITAAANGAAVTLTADEPGKPFSVTVVTTEADDGTADDQTFIRTSITANGGPHVVSAGANWEGGTAPVDGDDIVFDTGESDVLYDLDQNGVTPASITVAEGYKGKIGLPEINTDDATAAYYEYREKYLRYGNSGDAQTIALTIRGGAGRIKINTGTAQAIWNVTDTSQRLEDGVPAVLLKGTHAGNALHVSKGDVGLALFAGESATLLTLNVGYKTNPAGDAQVKLGAGVSLADAAIVQTGGTLEINSATSGAATITQYDGTLTLNAGAQTGLSVRGGDCIYNSTGALGGNTVVSGSGHLDFSQDLRTKSVTNPIDLFGPSAKLSDPNKVIDTLVVDLDETANGENVNIGTNIRLTRGSPA
jgi:hypothetical protein